MVYLGIDIGTSGTKTLAIDEAGNILAESNESYPCYQPKPLWSEQDPEDWWQATVNTIKAVIKKANLKRQDVKAIGLSGQMHGSVFLDKEGSIIRRAILWNDQRTTNECLDIERLAGGRQELIELVANPALAGFTAPKILWLKNHEPKNFEKLDKVLLPKDEIRRRLTGEFATDVSDASGMLLFDVANRKWSKKLIDKLSLPMSYFARVYESNEVTGKLTRQVADLLGLSPECLVVAGAGDCAAGAVGNGIVEEGLLSTSIGTSGVVFVQSNRFAVDPLGRLHTFCHAVKDKWHMMGVNLASGACLQWFANQLCQGELTKYAGNTSMLLEQLTKEAEKISPGSDGLFFLPYLSGERTPHADADARACFIGLTQVHGRGHMVRAIMEGVTFNLKESLEIIRSLKVPIEEIRVTGGGAQSEFWRQMQADIFNQPVSMLATEHGAAYGAALLAATGAGAFNSIEQASKVIAVRQKLKPSAYSREIYKRTFPIYQSFYDSLKSSFKDINQLAEGQPSLVGSP